MVLLLTVLLPKCAKKVSAQQLMSKCRAANNLDLDLISIILQGIKEDHPSKEDVAGIFQEVHSLFLNLS
jgi:hypothetical protein